jgi:hypothetical protein
MRMEELKGEEIEKIDRLIEEARNFIDTKESNKALSKIIEALSVTRKLPRFQRKKKVIEIHHLLGYWIRAI